MKNNNQIIFKNFINLCSKIPKMKKVTILTLILFFLQSCNTVKEYEKEKINDPDMKLAARSSERFETNFQVYREAAAGANGGKTGGGCGCN